MSGSRLEFVCAAHMPFHASESPQILNVHAGHRDAAIRDNLIGLPRLRHDAVELVLNMLGALVRRHCDADAKADG